MKKITLILSLFATSLGFAQTTLPFDFEGSNPTFTDFDGGAATIVTNPQSSGINTSGNVVQIVRTGGAAWAGSKVTGMTMDFSTLSTITLKFYTTAPVGTVVKLKLEDGSTTIGDVDAITSVSGSWETLTFDFAPFSGSDHTTLVFIPDMGNVGDGTANSTFFIDDVEQAAAIVPLTGLPIDFESGIESNNFTNFDGGSAKVIDNPHINTDNGSAKVGQIIRYGTTTWAGSKLNFSSNIDFTTNKFIELKVYTDAPIGTKMLLKTEKPGWGEEKFVFTTKTGEWETLIVDFTGVANDMPTLAFMFDFGNPGIGNYTFYFDDVKQTDGTTGGGPTGLGDNIALELTVSPNPSSTSWSISSGDDVISSVSIFDGLGNQIESLEANSKSVTIGNNNLSDGIYIAKVRTNNGISTLRLVKN